MNAAREPDQADFDLERFIDMFDEAMTSKDPRVIETLRNLLMIVALTRPESSNQHSKNHGPLRRMFEDMNHLNRRMSSVEDDVRQISRDQARNNMWAEKDKYTMAGAQKMAQQIDNDVLRQLSAKTAMQVNGGVWPKGTLK